MRRRPEAYHEKLRAHEAATPDVGRGPRDTDRTDGGDRPASIHDIVMTKQSGLGDLLNYDGYERRSGLVRVLPLETTPREIAEGSAGDLVDTLTIPWELTSIGDDRVALRLRAGPFELRKEIAIGGGRLDPTLSVEVEATNVSSSAVDGRLGIEFAMMLLGGGHNPAAFHAIDGRRIAHDESIVAQAVDGLRAGNEQVGVAVETVADGPVDAWISPIESVSNSESGFELVYQGSTVVLHRQFDLAPGEAARIRVEQRATVTADVAVAEVPTRP
jgi:4-alpha-glucanotransferase